MSYSFFSEILFYKSTHTSKFIFTKNLLQRVCLAACEDQQNNVAMTTSRLPNRQTMLEWPDFCVVLRKIEVSCKQPWKRVDLDKTYPSLCSSLLDKVPIILNCYRVSIIFLALQRFCFYHIVMFRYKKSFR